VEKYGTARQATDNNIWHMCIACVRLQTHSQNV